MEPQTPSKSKPQNHQFFQNPRLLKFGLALLLIIVLLLGGGIFTGKIGLADFISEWGFFYTVVLDCGSTGTRVNVYKWTVKGSDTGSLPVLLHSYPQNFDVKHGCQYHCVQTVPGLDKFVGNTSGVRAALSPLIRLAEQWVPSIKHHETPIFALGTAGMRGLSSDDARNVLKDVENVLKEHRFMYRKGSIRVLSGKEEAYYGWIALNHKMAVFDDQSVSPTLGLLDLGGSSLQVVAEVDELGENEHTFISKLGSFEHYVAAYSFPGFGFSKAFDRTIAMLYYNHDSSDGVIEIRHPCLKSGFLQNYTCPHCLGLSPSNSQSIQNDTDGTNVKLLRLVGGSNWEDCKAIAAAAAAAVNSSSPELVRQEARSDCKGFSAHGGEDHFEISRLKGLLSKVFEVKDLGALKYFLGMEVARTKDGISVSQRKYILDLLRETGMLGCKPAISPVDPSLKLIHGTEVVHKARYQRLVGKLLYLSHTRPDIAYAVSIVSQFLQSPTKDHWEAVYRILRYLKMTPGQGLHYKKSENKNVVVYTDADWAGNPIDRRSTTGYCSYVWGNLVTWRSKKQPTVSRSSAEAELRALVLGICEGLWLKRVLSELKIPLKIPITLYCDNKSALCMAENPIHHDKTKHVDIDRHFINEKLEDKTISLQHVSSQNQHADILTKAIPPHTFSQLCNKLGCINIYNIV